MPKYVERNRPLRDILAQKLNAFLDPTKNKRDMDWEVLDHIGLHRRPKEDYKRICKESNGSPEKWRQHRKIEHERDVMYTAFFYELYSRWVEDESPVRKPFTEVFEQFFCEKNGYFLTRHCTMFEHFSKKI